MAAMTTLARSAGLFAVLGFVAPVLAADQALIDAARREGVVNWYTVQIVDQLARPAAAAFEKKYGVKADFVRGEPNEIVLRITNESKAGQIRADVFDGTTTAPLLKKAGLAMKWQPDSAKRLPPQYLDREGYWTATNLYVLTAGYNTELVPRGQQPKSFKDLLDSRWKGKMAWSLNATSVAAPGVVGLALADMGPEQGRAYLRQLAGQSVTGLRVTARQVLDQVIAGEYQIGVGIMNSHAVISAGQGAPVDWIAMDPSLAVLSVVGVLKEPLHPNAARLFVEFLVSEEGQTIFRDANYLPVDPGVPPKTPGLTPESGKFRAIFLTPEEIDQRIGEWTGLLKEMFP